MTKKTNKIAEVFGKKLITIIGEFSTEEVPTISDYENNWFNYVSTVALRTAVSRIMHSARVIYKVALALQMNSQGLFGFVRAQIIDYAAVCEALLRYTLDYGCKNAKFPNKTVSFKMGKHPKTVLAQNLKVDILNFSVTIDVAEQLGIVDSTLKRRLHKLRLARNSVHPDVLASKALSYGLAESNYAYATFIEVNKKLQFWKGTH